MKKNYFLLAAAAMAMAGCANDTDLSGNSATVQGNGAILFNMNTPAITREGTTNASATALGNEFIVWGEKNENGAATLDNNGVGANVVFENYRVQNTANSANTTASNTKDWEYVGITPYNGNGSAPQSGEGDESNASVSPSIYKDANTKQTIKYWDFGKPYTFTAVSAKQADIKGGKVKITKNYSETTATNKGYTIELGEGASLGDVYVADRQTVTKDNANSVDAVTMTFRKFQSKIRFGIYETVPGYKVVITGIKYNDGTNDVIHPTTATESGSSNKNFAINGKFITAGTNTKYKVTYGTTDSGNENKPEVTLEESEGSSASSSSYLETEGTNWLDATSGIGKEATSPTWDNVTTTTGSEDQSSTTTVNWTYILPNTSNKTNLKLQIAYKLISEDTGEVIEFKTTENGTTTETYRTVEVPAEYCQWKPNYAYTYLFKISDKSAELYPITFDALVVAEETGNQETITTMDGDTYITTIGKRTTTTGSTSTTTIVNGSNEYLKGDVIYATVYENNSLVTLLTSNVQLYTVTTTDATNYPITEASVLHALNQASGTTTKVTLTKMGSGSGGAMSDSDLSYEIPTEDGTTIKLDENNKKALTWTAADNAVYAIVYTNSSNSKKCKIVRINGATTTTQN